MPSLQQYTCHKRVRAAKIVDIVPDPKAGEDGFRIKTACEVDGEDSPRIYVTSAWLAERYAEVGGYFVQYEDGYTSYSPAKAFEEGYALVGEEPLELQLWCQTQGANGEYGEKQQVQLRWPRDLHVLTLKLMLAEVLRGNLRTRNPDGSPVEPAGYAFSPGDDVSQPAATAIEAYARGLAADNGMQLATHVRLTLDAYLDYVTSGTDTKIMKFGEAVAGLRRAFKPFEQLFVNDGQTVHDPGALPLDLTGPTGEEMKAPEGSEEQLARARNIYPVTTLGEMQEAVDEQLRASRPAAVPEAHHSVKQPLPRKDCLWEGDCGCWDQDMTGRAFSLTDPTPALPQTDFVGLGTNPPLRHFCDRHWAARNRMANHYAHRDDGK